MYCRHYLISGQVQGVYYRASTRDKALALGLTGWVQNLPDGRVEAVACGELGAVAEFEEWLWKGPVTADVENVEVGDWPAEPLEGFELRR